MRTNICHFSYPNCSWHYCKCRDWLRLAYMAHAAVLLAGSGADGRLRTARSRTAAGAPPVVPCYWSGCLTLENQTMPVLGYSQRCLWEVHANTQHPGKRNTTMLRTEDFKHDGRSAMDAVCIFKKNAPFPQQGPVELGWPPRLLLWGRPCTTAHPPSPAPGAGKGAALLPSAGAAGSQPPRKKKEMFYFFSKPPSLLLCPAEGPGAASPPVSHNAPGRKQSPTWPAARGAHHGVSQRLPASARRAGRRGRNRGRGRTGGSAGCRGGRRRVVRGGGAVPALQHHAPPPHLRQVRPERRLRLLRRPRLREVLVALRERGGGERDTLSLPCPTARGWGGAAPPHFAPRCGRWAAPPPLPSGPGVGDTHDTTRCVCPVVPPPLSPPFSRCPGAGGSGCGAGERSCRCQAHCGAVCWGGGLPHTGRQSRTHNAMLKIIIKNSTLTFT